MLENSRSLPSFLDANDMTLRPKSSGQGVLADNGRRRSSVVTMGKSMAGKSPFFLKPVDAKSWRPMTVLSDPGHQQQTPANLTLASMGQSRRPVTVGGHKGGPTIGGRKEGDWSAMWAFPIKAEPSRGSSTVSDGNAAETFALPTRPSPSRVREDGRLVFSEMQRWVEAKMIVQKSADILPALRDPGIRHTSHKLDPIEHSIESFSRKKSGMTSNSKRTNAINAMEKDRNHIQQKCVDEAEGPVERKEREAPVDNHHWSLMFSPIKGRPQDHVPPVFAGTADPLVLQMPRIWDHPREPILTNFEATTLLRVCKAFASVVRPHVSDGEDRGAEVITRPALCRMLLALRMCGPGNRFIYQSVIRQFDALADVCAPRGCPLTAGVSCGLALAPPRGREKNVNELPIVKTFGYVLESLAEELRGSRPLDQQLQIVKEVFITSQLEAAEMKAKKLYNQVDGMLARGRGVFNVPETHIESIRAHPVEGAKSDKKKKSKDGPDSKSGTKSAAPKSGGRKSTTKQMEEAPKEDPLPQQTQPLNPADALYAHTFTVSKGELLKSMVLEPEMLQFTWMFSGIAETLFQAYSDVPTDFLGSSNSTTSQGGHMSYGGFMRFCIDFGLFPTVVDFCTLQCIYRSSECAMDLTRDDILQVMERDKNTLKFKVDDVVELEDRAVAQVKGPGLRFGEPGLIIAVDYDKETQAARVMTRTGKKRWYQFEDLKLCPQAFVLYEKEKKETAATRCEWVNKDIGEMSEDEVKALSLLSAMEDWIADHRLRVKDVFGMFDQSGERTLTATDIMKGVQFMNLENCPSMTDMEAILVIIDEDGSGEIDIPELDSVLMAVRERKARHKKAGNFFMTPKSEMTGIENAAAEFFVPLEAALTNRGWGAVEFFETFDADGSGSMDLQELVTAAKHLGIHVDDVDLFKRSCILVDPNMDGTFEVGELNRVLAMVREKLRTEEMELQDAKNPFLSLGATSSDGQQIVRVFGFKAFMECLLKIGLAYMSFHGSYAQSELPSYTKALWLLAFLSWQFGRRKLEYKMAKALEVEKELKRGFGEDVGDAEKSEKVSAWAKRTTSHRRSNKGLSTVLSGMEAKGLRKKIATLSSVEEDENGSEDDAEDSAPVSRDLFNAKKTQGKQPLRSRESKKKKQQAEAEAAAQAGKESLAGDEDRPKPLTGVGKLARMKLQKVVAEKRFAAYLPPLKRLIVQHATLFSKALRSPPQSDGSSSAKERHDGPCPTCGTLSQQGWGNAFCPDCGQADEILSVTLLSNNPNKFPVLDKMLCSAAAPLESADDHH